MTIYVQKLSIPAEEWDIDVEPSDTIEAVKQKLEDKELFVYQYSKIRIFKDSVELVDTSTLSDYGILKFTHLTTSYDSDLIDCDPLFDKWASPPDTMAPPFSNANPESGCSRYRRLRLLGYI